jgi:hypothetical protein
MKGRFRSDLKRLAAGLMIALMVLLLVNRAVYIHIHVLPDGSVHSHAHPFSKNPHSSNGTGHQHSSLEFFLLDQFETLAFMASVLFALKPFARYSFMGSQVNEHLLPALVPVSPGRAPPVSI